MAVRRIEIKDAEALSHSETQNLRPRQCRRFEIQYIAASRIRTLRFTQQRCVEIAASKLVHAAPEFVASADEQSIFEGPFDGH